MTRYTHVVDGEWYEASWKGQRDCCCDCGLVHITDYKIVDGKLFFRTKRSERATKAARKRFKKELEKC